MNKPQLIRLIHVAKTQLGMDDETYRAKLDALTGKTSCSQMSLDQLNAVYQSFKDAGFKRQFKRKAVRASRLMQKVRAKRRKSLKSALSGA